jgi:hypothetical protein
LIDAQLPAWSANRKDANTEGEGKRATTLIISWWALRGWDDDTKIFKHTYFFYCPGCRLVKVGCTNKPPLQRLKEVQSDHQCLFPSPTPWELKWLATFQNNQQVRFRRRKFPGLYARREWLRYVPRVKRFLSRAIAADPAVRGRDDLPPVPDWTPLRERRVFKRRRKCERDLLTQVLCAASTETLAMLYDRLARRGGDAMP